MSIDFNLLNLLTLVGGIQGFSLAIFLLKERKTNPKAFWAFFIFIISLSLFNSLYALNYMQISKIGFIPLTAFPVPEDYLVGVGLYFYVTRHRNSSETKRIFKKEYLLFLPALLYGMVRSYWYVVSILEDSNRLILKVYNTHFFDVNEVVVNVFYLLLVYSSWRFIRKHFHKNDLPPKQVKSLEWIKKLLLVFAIVTVFNFIIYIFSILFNSQDNAIFYYPKLIINTGFIYWVGFIGFSKRNLLFSNFQIEDSTEEALELHQKLYNYMVANEMYKNPDIRLSEIAHELGVSSKKLSSVIHKIDKVNFSEYVNIFRIEKVKSLLLKDESDRYTLVALAKEAGFKSKSTFNAVFKKMEGITPSEYKKQIKK